MKHKAFNTITGLTQQETAMWLCIPRSQWSMYESGKRSLPQKSIVHFAMLLQELKNNKRLSDEKKALHLKEDKEITTNFLKEIKNLEFNILRLQRKIMAMEDKRNKCLAALDVAYFIENNPKKDAPQDLAKVIKNRCLKTLDKYPLYRLENMKLKVESFEMLKQKIVQKIPNQNPIFATIS